MSEKTVDQFSVKYIQVLNENGEADEKLMPHLSDDDIRTMYWYMNLSRILNTKMLNLQKQGRMGTLASTQGQEAAQVGGVYALKDINNAWLVPTFRENAALVTRGVEMLKMMQYWGGYEVGSKTAKEKVLPVNIPVGSTSLHAVGIGMSMNIKGEKGVTMSFFGDGATSEGESHEAMNFAGVFRSPTIFFCQNNQYAISVPRAKQTASKTLAEKAFSYGFEGVQVDGNDAFAVYKVVKEAADKAMRGEGPTFVEAITYRIDNHTTADDWKKYRHDGEVEEWLKKDPVDRLRKYMMNKGLWTDEQEKAMLEDARKKVESAVEEYEKMGKPKVEEIFDYLYKELPPIIKEQKEYFVNFWGEQ